MAINIKSEREIQLMRESCKILAKVHDELGKFIMNNLHHELAW